MQGFLCLALPCYGLPPVPRVLQQASLPEMECPSWLRVAGSGVCLLALDLLRQVASSSSDHYSFSIANFYALKLFLDLLAQPEDDGGNSHLPCVASDHRLTISQWLVGIIILFSNFIWRRWGQVGPLPPTRSKADQIVSVVGGSPLAILCPLIVSCPRLVSCHPAISCPSPFRVLV